MVIDTMDVYIVRIIWFGCDRYLELAFTHPPVREDIAPLLEEAWKGVSPEQQNNGWEFRLIADLIPLESWEGVSENVYGSLNCRKRKLNING